MSAVLSSSLSNHSIHVSTERVKGFSFKEPDFYAASRLPSCIDKKTAACSDSFLQTDQRFFSMSFRPISTPMTDAIIKPRVQPELSPRQCRPRMLVSRFSSILTLLE